MKKLIFAICLLGLFIMPAIGQEKASDAKTSVKVTTIKGTTSDGRAVLLRSDGTWEFAAADKPGKPIGVTMAGFNALANGMSYEEAVAILGRAGEKLSESDLGGVQTVMYQWKADRGSLGANMNAMFQDGKLILKAQAGLK